MGSLERWFRFADGDVLVTPDERVQVRKIHTDQIRVNEHEIELLMVQVHGRERAIEMRRNALAEIDAEEAAER